jgi:exonuclease V gamma subunit
MKTIKSDVFLMKVWILVESRVTRRFIKNCLVFQKVAKTVSEFKINAKISISKFNLKVKNIYKTLLKPYSTHNKLFSETVF